MPLVEGRRLDSRVGASAAFDRDDLELRTLGGRLPGETDGEESEDRGEAGFPIHSSTKTPEGDVWSRDNGWQIALSVNGVRRRGAKVDPTKLRLADLEGESLRIVAGGSLLRSAARPPARAGSWRR